MSTKDENRKGCPNEVDGESESNHRADCSSPAASQRTDCNAVSTNESSKKPTKPKISYGRAIKSAPESYAQARKAIKKDLDRSDEAD